MSTLMRILLGLLLLLMSAPQASAATQRRDSLADARQLSMPDLVAVISEAPAAAHRVVNSRPQRLLPTQGPGPGRSVQRSTAHAQRTTFYVQSLTHTTDSRLRRERSPYCSAASADYYVIALRHIIR